jgi:hypothetical protein
VECGARRLTSFGGPSPWQKPSPPHYYYGQFAPEPEKLGIQQDLGSIEAGKLADLLVLTANPLENIENSLDLKYTVADGVIYDSATLEVVWPKKSAAEQ